MDGPIKRSNEEVDALYLRAEIGEYETKFGGMNFEQGILETLRWLFGEQDEAPIE